MAVQLTAVMILAIFYGCYFSKMLAQRRKGIQTDQMGKGKTGEARTIELTMKVTTLLVPLVELMSIYRNISGLPGWVRYLGIVLALLGDRLVAEYIGGNDLGAALQHNADLGGGRTGGQDLGIFRIGADGCAKGRQQFLAIIFRKTAQQRIVGEQPDVLRRE